jgi:hypothetical protein
VLHTQSTLSRSLLRASSNSLVRVIYASYFIVFQPYRINPALSNLPDSLWIPPVGPFSLLRGYPSATAVSVLMIGILGALVLLLLGYQTRNISVLVSVLLIVSAGIRFSTGKIDHDILLLILPFIYRNSWGSTFAVKPQPFREATSLPYLISFFFFSSAVIKMTSGYLNLGSQSIYEWLKFYEFNYGFLGIFGPAMANTSPLNLEILDYASVFVEVIIAILFFLRKTRIVAIFLALIFHLTIFLIFGIDFSKLFLVYIALLIIPISTKRRQVTGNLFLTMLLWIFVLLMMLIIKNYVSAYPLIFLTAIPMMLLIAINFIRYRDHLFLQRVVGRTSTIKVLSLALPLILTIFWTEPYPALIGPGFRGQVSGCTQQMVTRNGEKTTFELVFNIQNPFAQNLGFQIYPNSSFQGHETRVWKAKKFVNNDLEVKWIQLNC